MKDQTLKFILKRLSLKIFFSILILIIGAPAIAFADIKFGDVSLTAGIFHSGHTFGASWGDFNGDGWPDLWVGNHYNAPSLYLNQQNGTFLDIVKDVWSEYPKADTHGAAWADFDNDGDQDLVELCGAESGTGKVANHLFVNQDGMLKNQASLLGVGYPLGRGRTPLWFDADKDGLLDLLVVNIPRLDDQAPSTVFRQTQTGFQIEGDKFGFKGSRPTKVDKIKDLARNIWNFNFQMPKYTSSVGFAQLADLSHDGNLDLVLFSSPSKVFVINPLPFHEITNPLGFPRGIHVKDAATEDFDGDGNMDLFLARGSFWQSAAIKLDPFRVQLHLVRKKETFPAVHLFTEGNLTFKIYPRWVYSSNIAIGSTGWQPQGRIFSLSSQDPRVRKSNGSQPVGQSNISIYYDNSAKMWSINSSMTEVNFEITSTEKIHRLETIGFDPSENQDGQLLLIRDDKGFLPFDIDGITSCHSVAAGDYDNDMDVDLYLVRAGPVSNLPNILLENDGSGNFSVVANAGGAAGSEFGLGEVAVTADYDRDGFLDLFITNGLGTSPFADDGPQQLFHNLGNENHWIEIDLEGVKSNRDGIGAFVQLETGGVLQTRQQGGGMHAFAQNHQRIHFGLGPHLSADRITVRWPSGIVQTLENVRADQLIRIVESP